MKRQGVDTLLPLDCVNTHHRRFARELDCGDNRIELGHIEISLEMLTRLPFFDQQQSLTSVEIRIETSIQAARRDPRWTEHGAKNAQQSCSSLIGNHDLHREYDQGSYLSVAACKMRNGLRASHRKKRANAKDATRLRRNIRWISGVLKAGCEQLHGQLNQILREFGAPPNFRRSPVGDEPELLDTGFECRWLDVKKRRSSI